MLRNSLFEIEKMPKRKLEKPSKETLGAIKQAQKRGIPLTEDDALKIRNSTCRVPTDRKLPFGASISKVEKGKKGELRFWTPDHPKGPGRLELPLTRALQEKERDWLTAMVKQKRQGRPPPQESVEAKQSRSKTRAIESALRKLGLYNRNAVIQISRKLEISTSRVYQVRKKMRAIEGSK